jgi:hypothetical protein
MCCWNPVQCDHSFKSFMFEMVNPVGLVLKSHLLLCFEILKHMKETKFVKSHVSCLEILKHTREARLWSFNFFFPPCFEILKTHKKKQDFVLLWFELEFLHAISEFSWNTKTRWHRPWVHHLPPLWCDAYLLLLEVYMPLDFFNHNIVIREELRWCFLVSSHLSSSSSSSS